MAGTALATLPLLIFICLCSVNLWPVSNAAALWNNRHRRKVKKWAGKANGAVDMDPKAEFLAERHAAGQRERKKEKTKGGRSMVIQGWFEKSIHKVFPDETPVSVRRRIFMRPDGKERRASWCPGGSRQYREAEFFAGSQRGRRSIESGCI